MSFLIDNFNRSVLTIDASTWSNPDVYGLGGKKLGDATHIISATNGTTPSNFPCENAYKSSCFKSRKRPCITLFILKVRFPSSLPKIDSLLLVNFPSIVEKSGLVISWIDSKIAACITIRTNCGFFNKAGRSWLRSLGWSWIVETRCKAIQSICSLVGCIVAMFVGSVRSC